MSAGICPDCGKSLSRGATRCRKHANAMRNRTPEMRESARQRLSERQKAGMPRNDAATSARLKAMYEDPERRAALARAGAIGRANRTPENCARGYARQSETKRMRREERLAWCPADRREEYHKLSRKLGIAEAKRIVLADIAAQQRKRLAGMTQHERNLERVRNGATLINKPVLRRGDHAFSLTGSSMGSIG